MTTSDIIINLRVNALAAKKELKDTQAQMKKFQGRAMKGSKEQEAAFENIAQAQQKAHKHQEALNQKISKQFPAWALSIMFFGMVVHRTMSSIWRAASSTFQDISHSVEGTVTQFDHLNGAMTWLKFVTGSALEPIAAMLYPIVLIVADWVDQNQELVRQLVIVIGAIGTLSALTGGATVAAAGFARAWRSVVATFAAFKSGGAIITGLKAIAAFVGGSMVVAFGVVAAVVIGLVALWTTNFGGFRDFLQDTFGVIYETIKTVFKDAWTIIKEVFNLVVAILEGDWESAWNAAIGVVSTAVGAIIKILMGLGAIIANIFITAANIINDVFTRIINGFLWGIEQTLRIAGRMGLASRVADIRANISSGAEFLKMGTISADDIRGGFDRVDGGIESLVNNINIEVQADPGATSNELMYERLAEDISQRITREIEARGT